MANMLWRPSQITIASSWVEDCSVRATELIATSPAMAVSVAGTLKDDLVSAAVDAVWW